MAKSGGEVEVFASGLPGMLPQAPPVISVMPMHVRSSSSRQQMVPLDHLAGELDGLLKKQHRELLRLLSDMARPRRPDGPRGSCDSDAECDAIPDLVPCCESPQWKVVLQAKRTSAQEMGVDRGQSPDNLSDVEDALAATAVANAERNTSKTTTNTVDSEISFDKVVGISQHSNVHQASRELLHRQKKGTDWQGKLLRFTAHYRYELANACIILINAVLIAWETDYSAHRARSHEAKSVVFDVLMFVFGFIFATDLGLRLAAQGSLFFYSLDWKWNLFDAVVVSGSVLEVVAFLLNSKDSWVSNASLLRVVRLLRVARIVRAFRSMVYFRDLRITIAMLCDALVPMVTFASIMAMIFMVFGIFFTDGATAYVLEHGEDADLSKIYGSLPISMTTLYKAISGGMDWENAAEPLKKLSAVYLLVFYAYVTFSIFALLNVVSAMFVDQTINRSKNDRDYIVQTEIQGKREFFNTMDKLFEELDPDRSGTINIQELKGHIMDPKVNAYFRAIDLNVFKVKKLFQLMDTDNSGEIDIKEFAQGCTRLRGEAKELDVAILQYEVKQLAAETVAIKCLVHEMRDLIAQKSSKVVAS